MEVSKPQRVWTVAEAKARLSEVLRLGRDGRAAAHRDPASVRCGARRGVGRENAAA